MTGTAADHSARYQRWSIAFLVLIYVAGIAGICSPWHGQFNSLTPFTLIISAILLIINHRDRNPVFSIFFLLIFIAGFLIELTGVRTGVIFGSYLYGETLGPQLAGIPLVIGINWFILTYCAGTVTGKIGGNIIVKAALGAFILVILDFLIEPVATHYGYWFWENDTIPVRNYLAWFVCSFLFLLLFHRMGINRNNKVAYYLLALQFCFFIALGINNIGECC